MAGSELMLTRDTGGEITLGRAKVVSSDMLALNGVVHVIDTVLLPQAWSTTIDLLAPTNKPSPQPIREEPQDCFECPENAERINGSGCSGTIDDCQCLQGYRMLNDECVFCSYDCPWNSSPLPGLECINSLEDCECNWGFVWDDSRCELAPFGCNFQCPPNSSRKSNRMCYDTFDDCECDDGFSRGQSRCF